MDAKVLSKALVNRIIKVLPKIIHGDQSAFVKGRFIGEPIRLVSDVLYYTKENNLQGILFGADFESAFDSLDQIFMVSVLKKFGFGSSFIKWVKVMHTGIESSVLNGGYSTGYFPLERGTRQGDPLAQYLFIVAIEILATLVRNNNNIKGITIHGKQVKLGVFADDTTFFLHDTESLGEVLKVLKVFSGYSSMNVNYEKSEIAWIGSWRKREDNPYPFNWINLTKESIRILGIFFHIVMT